MQRSGRTVRAVAVVLCGFALSAGRGAADDKPSKEASKPDAKQLDALGKKIIDGLKATPGCLGVDALWQLLGFFLGWLGLPGRGRALGLGELKFSGQVLPTMKNVVYGIDIRRVMRSKLVLGIGDGWLSADGNMIYQAKDLKVGLFRQDAMMEPSGG